MNTTALDAAELRRSLLSISAKIRRTRESLLQIVGSTKEKTMILHDVHINLIEASQEIDKIADEIGLDLE